MRVIGGRWRGRRLVAPRGETVRPTTDRVKEAVFGLLGDRVAGATVLDLCCGAGGLGIEALSRGAARAVFVDSDRTALAAVRGNLAACGADPGEATLIRAEAVAWLGHWQPPRGTWLLLADPPYATAVAAALVPLIDRLAADPGFAAAVLEHPFRGPALPETACGRDVRRYGETAITILEPAGFRRGEGT
ncbi:MAG: RsmD family RNA methyltransferase [Krumholzibacteria bacterium]|nr:RsmD family RNA methyltransferase [Candidatus Krumholzibacteria bacterium]